MRTIDVSFPEFRDPTFNTAQEAIAETARRSRGPLSLAVRGQRITDVLWNATDFYARLEGQSGGLRIYQEGESLAVELTEETPEELLTAPNWADQEVIVLDYESGTKVEWDRAKLAAKLRGKSSTH